MPSADAITDLVMADIDSIPRDAGEPIARRAAILSIVQHIRDAVIASTVTVDGTGLSTAPGGGPVSGTAIGAIS